MADDEELLVQSERAVSCAHRHGRNTGWRVIDAHQRVVEAARGAAAHHLHARGDLGGGEERHVAARAHGVAEDDAGGVTTPTKT